MFSTLPIPRMLRSLILSLNQRRAGLTDVSRRIQSSFRSLITTASLYPATSRVANIEFNVPLSTRWACTSISSLGLCLRISRIPFMISTSKPSTSIRINVGAIPCSWTKESTVRICTCSLRMKSTSSLSINDEILPFCATCISASPFSAPAASLNVLIL